MNLRMKGMENQYLFNLQCFKHNGESDNVTSLLQPPIRLALNKDTIFDCVSPITKAYKYSQDSSYTKISNSLFGGFSHDSITKFGIELLGIFIQGTDTNTMEPIIAPKCLLQINGGHTAVDLVNWLISVMTKHINIKGSAYHKIQSYLERTDHDYDSNVSLPEYFKLGVLHHINKNDQEIQIETKSMPIANTGDGVVLNGRVSRLLCLCYGLDAPCYHCAARSSDLAMKQMVKSKTVSVPLSLLTKSY